MVDKLTNQMFPWVDETVNPIRGQCPHQCSYCYVPHTRVAHLYKDKPHLVESALGTIRGKGKTVFIGSMIDMWAYDIHGGFISKVLKRCREYPQNTYVFLTKNPERFGEFFFEFPLDTMLGITLETNEYEDDFTEAPDPANRAWTFADLSMAPYKLTKFVSIEPIMKFDLGQLLTEHPTPLPELIKEIKPTFVSIGADSKDHKLPEPPAQKVLRLIERLSEFTEVRIKPNMKRLI